MRHYGAYYKSKLGYEYILDTVPGASLALSLRKLRSDYNGPCIRIRRSSDNAELDIGFVNNWVDIDTILTFIGAGSGYIVTFYDQSGYANNITISTATLQPLFVLNVFNTHPALYFNGSNWLTSTNDYTINPLFPSQPISNYLVIKFISGSVIIGSSNTTNRNQFGYGGGQLYCYAGNSLGYNKSIPFTNQFSIEWNGNASKLFEDGVIKLSGNFGNQYLSDLQLFSLLSSGVFAGTGYMPEVIGYTSINSIVDRQKIEVSQKITFGL